MSHAVVREVILTRTRLPRGHLRGLGRSSSGPGSHERWRVAALQVPAHLSLLRNPRLELRAGRVLRDVAGARLVPILGPLVVVMGQHLYRPYQKLWFRKEETR